eukprot:3516397-Pyramimonas_sp.AAC.1
MRIIDAEGLSATRIWQPTPVDSPPAKVTWGSSDLERAWASAPRSWATLAQGPTLRSWPTKKEQGTLGRFVQAPAGAT